MYKELHDNDLDLLAIDNVDPIRLSQLANNKKLWLNMRNVFPHPYSVKDAEQFISMDFGKNLRWAIHSKGDFVGMIGLHRKNDVHCHTLEVGYWIGEPYWGNGFATGALNLVTDFAFTLPDIKRIYAAVFDYNKGSAKVLRKAGFKEEGRSIKAIYKDGQYVDELRFGLVKEGL